MKLLRTRVSIYEGDKIMVSAEFGNEIAEFLELVQEPYECVEQVSQEGVARILADYVPACLALLEAERRTILHLLRDSWLLNQDHKHVRRWGRATVGIAEFLLKPTDHDEVQRLCAADVVTRVSRWYYTENNLWTRFRGYAHNITDLIWGNIEPLYEHYGGGRA